MFVYHVDISSTANEQLAVRQSSIVAFHDFSINVLFI